MQIFCIENNEIKISVSSYGAELQSIYNKINFKEYLWNADSNFWSKKSPVLFPIVGGLKNNQYNYQEKSYTLNRHGFAREKEFEVFQNTSNSIQFVLTSNEETLKIYPFHFKLIIEYSILNNQLFCNYSVENLGAEEMYFSIGGHPAFKVPLTDNSTFEDWYLEFNKTENSDIFPLTAEGLIQEQSTSFFKTTNTLTLNKELFYKDALVFKNLQSNKISLKSNSSEHGLTMQFDDFNYYGIWSAKNADFVCLEPWCGIADSVNASGDISLKEGINKLEANEIFSRTWSVEIY